MSHVSLISDFSLRRSSASERRTELSALWASHTSLSLLLFPLLRIFGSAVGEERERRVPLAAHARLLDVQEEVSTHVPAERDVGLALRILAHLVHLRLVASRSGPGLAADSP